MEDAKRPVCTVAFGTISAHLSFFVLIQVNMESEPLTSSALWILVPQLCISVVSWIQLVFSMNRFRGFHRFTTMDMWALLLFIHSGFVRWIAALAVKTSSVEFQITAALVSSTLGWISFVVVFNECFSFPSRQQRYSLFLSIIATGLWEVSNRLVFEM